MYVYCRKWFCQWSLVSVKLMGALLVKYNTPFRMILRVVKDCFQINNYVHKEVSLNLKCVSNVNVNVNVHVYSSDIPVSSAVTPLLLETYSFAISSPLGSFCAFCFSCIKSLQCSFFGPPGAHNCWVGKGSMEWANHYSLAFSFN